MNEKEVVNCIEIGESILEVERDINRIGEEMMNNGGKEKEEAITKALELQLDVRKDYDKFSKPYINKIRELGKKMCLHQSTLSKIMGEEKKVEAPGIKIEKKVTKSLQVVDKPNIVSVLMKNDKVNDGISTFNLKFLRSLKDVGLLDDDAAIYSLKESIYVKDTEAL